MHARGPRRLPLERYAEGVLGGDRMVLARAITVIESNLHSDGELAARLLDALLPHTGHSLRVGITGVPGVVMGRHPKPFTKADYDCTVVFRRKLDGVRPINCPPSHPIKPRN